MEDVGRYRDASLEREIFFNNAVQFFRLDADTLKPWLDQPGVSQGVGGPLPRTSMEKYLALMLPLKQSQRLAAE
jgi:hypothetical protein